MTHHAIEYRCYVNISLVVCRDNLTTGAILSLLIGDASDVLWEFVDRSCAI